MLAALRFFIVCVLLAYAVVLVIVLLNPSPAAPAELVDRVAIFGLRLDLPAAWVVPARVEFGLNVVAFLPVSLLGSLLRPSITVSTWTASGFAASMLVEAIQTTLPDRSATHADVVSNTLGAALGALLAWAALQAATRRD